MEETPKPKANRQDKQTDNPPRYPFPSLNLFQYWLDEETSLSTLEKNATRISDDPRFPQRDYLPVGMWQRTCREWVQRNKPSVFGATLIEPSPFLLPFGNSIDLYCDPRENWDLWHDDESDELQLLRDFAIWYRSLPLKAYLVVAQMVEDPTLDEKYGRWLRTLPEWQILVKGDPENMHSLGFQPEELTKFWKSNEGATVERRDGIAMSIRGFSRMNIIRELSLDTWLEAAGNDSKTRQLPNEAREFIFNARDALQKQGIVPTYPTVLFLLSDMCQHLGFEPFNIWPTKGVVVESLFFGPEPTGKHPADADGNTLRQSSYPACSSRVLSRVITGFQPSDDYCWRRVNKIIREQNRWWSSLEQINPVPSKNLNKRDNNPGRRGAYPTSDSLVAANDVELFKNNKISMSELINRERLRREQQHMDAELDRSNGNLVDKALLAKKPKRLSLEDSAILRAVQKRLERHEKTAT
ncbi:MAG: hypothetical protein V4671_05495 [Armatimonadota bacterium]